MTGIQSIELSSWPPMVHISRKMESGVNQQSNPCTSNEGVLPGILTPPSIHICAPLKLKLAEEYNRNVLRYRSFGNGASQVDFKWVLCISEAFLEYYVKSANRYYLTMFLWFFWITVTTYGNEYLQKCIIIKFCTDSTLEYDKFQTKVIQITSSFPITQMPLYFLILIFLQSVFHFWKLSVKEWNSP